MLVSSLAAVLGIYVAGFARLWRRTRGGRGVRPAQVAAFVGGWLALVAALTPPIDEWSERWQFAHMVQHELLMAVAAPLMAVGAPIALMLWALPLRGRRTLVVAVRRTRLPAVWRALTSPASGFLLYAAALWLWHVPALYDAALGDERVHVLQHLCFFGTASLFWWGLVHGRQGRVGYGMAAVYVFATTVHSGLLGALLTLAPHVWYAPYLTTRSGGLTPLEDQQLAGLLMWVPVTALSAAGGLALFAAWLRHSDRLSRFKSAAALEPTSLR
jgi:cytochrome c oxidase assembly factor CtaG